MGIETPKNEKEELVDAQLEEAEELHGNGKEEKGQVAQMIDVYEDLEGKFAQEAPSVAESYLEALTLSPELQADQIVPGLVKTVLERIDPRLAKGIAGSSKAMRDLGLLAKDSLKRAIEQRMEMENDTEIVGRLERALDSLNADRNAA